MAQYQRDFDKGSSLSDAQWGMNGSDPWYMQKPRDERQPRASSKYTELGILLRTNPAAVGRGRQGRQDLRAYAQAVRDGRASTPWDEEVSSRERAATAQRDHETGQQKARFEHETGRAKQEHEWAAARASAAHDRAKEYYDWTQTGEARRRGITDPAKQTQFFGAKGAIADTKDAAEAAAATSRASILNDQAWTSGTQTTEAKRRLATTAADAKQGFATQDQKDAADFFTAHGRFPTPQEKEALRLQRRAPSITTIPGPDGNPVSVFTPGAEGAHLLPPAKPTQQEVTTPTGEKITIIAGRAYRTNKAGKLEPIATPNPLGGIQ
ncbi:MAG: hypothetical protein LBR07_05265 [Puniceicoccales bacterium]|jgi:hypothetical protein|nr:hypothetical protein [Puniceicoccales bacterium]